MYPGVLTPMAGINGYPRCRTSIYYDSYYDSFDADETIQANAYRTKA